MFNSEKFLVVGAAGLIGKAAAQEIGTAFDWAGTAYSKPCPGLLTLDITKSEEVKRVFSRTKPNIAVHCANLAGGIDFCQKNPDLAKKFHFEGTVNLAKECLKRNAKFIFISSECVFDGKKEDYTEEDEAIPISVYGKYKTESEEWIRKNLKNYIIIRTMSVYGWDPKTLTPNAVMNLYFSIAAKKKVFSPVFRWGCPTYVGDLAKAIVELSLANTSGVFNIAGNSFVNWYERMKKTCKVLEWDSSFLIPKEKPSAQDLLRPLRISLNTEKFRKSFGTKLHNLKDGLSLLKQDAEADKEKSIIGGTV